MKTVCETNRKSVPLANQHTIFIRKAGKSVIIRSIGQIRVLSISHKTDNMLIAKLKKNENIAEYLLYMWQVEDMIRANEFDMEKIDANLVKHFQQKEEVEREIHDWYAGLTEMMISEGKKKEGHLQININTLVDLTDLHSKLLGSPEHLNYQQLFTKTYPIIEEFRQRTKTKGMGDIELCFVGLYSLWMLKLQKRNVTKETQEAMDSFSELVSALAKAYHQREQGEVEL